MAIADWLSRLVSHPASRLPRHVSPLTSRQKCQPSHIAATRSKAGIFWRAQLTLEVSTWRVRFSRPSSRHCALTAWVHLRPPTPQPLAIIFLPMSYRYLHGTFTLWYWYRTTFLLLPAVIPHDFHADAPTIMQTAVGRPLDTHTTPMRWSCTSWAS